MLHFISAIPVRQGETMVEQAAEFVANFDPWWMVTIAIALVLLDWLLLQTEAFMALGFGTLILAAENALHFSPMVQLWSYPIAIFSSFFLQRKLYELITTAKTPYQYLETTGKNGLEGHVGKIGTLKIILNKNESADHFFSYKDNLYKDSSIHSEPKTETTNTDTIKVSLEDGSLHPAHFVGRSDTIDGLRVKVKSVYNGALLVEEVK